jgi:hypothetical protein
MAKLKREYWTQRGKLSADGTLDEDAKLPLPHPQSEESDVERDGYRTLKQQIQELEDAGIALMEYYKRKYPGDA